MPLRWGHVAGAGCVRAARAAGGVNRSDAGAAGRVKAEVKLCPLQVCESKSHIWKQVIRPFDSAQALRMKLQGSVSLVVYRRIGSYEDPANWLRWSSISSRYNREEMGHPDCLQAGYSDLSEAMSIEKRYFTSDLSEPLVGFVDLLDGDDFDVGGDVVLAAEVEHLLGFGDAADGRAGEAAASEDEAERGDGQRLLGSADQGEVAVAASRLM